MARITRRKLLKLSATGAVAARTGGLAAILASGRAPAFVALKNYVLERKFLLSARRPPQIHAVVPSSAGHLKPNSRTARTWSRAALR